MHRSMLLCLAAGTLAGCGPKPSRTAAADSTAQFSSNRITVVTRGTGPDLVLIPGLTSDRAVWDSVAGQLEGRYRLHLIQVKGFAGLPAEGNADGPVAAPVAEEIARYISSQQLGKPGVVGHSMGGTIALMVAARHPEQVGKVMVLDMPAFMGEMFGGPGATAESVKHVADSMRIGMLAAPRDSFVATMGAMLAGMTRKEGLKPVLLGYLQGSDQKVVANSFHELIITDLRPELSHITAPLEVLYVMPVGSPIPPAQYEAAMRASFANAPNAKLVKVEDSYHFIQLDQPARLIAAIDSLMGP